MLAKIPGRACIGIAGARRDETAAVFRDAVLWLAGLRLRAAGLRDLEALVFFVGMPVSRLFVVSPL